MPKPPGVRKLKNPITHTKSKQAVRTPTSVHVTDTRLLTKKKRRILDISTRGDDLQRYSPTDAETTSEGAVHLWFGGFSEINWILTIRSELQTGSLFCPSILINLSISQIFVPDGHLISTGPADINITFHKVPETRRFGQSFSLTFEISPCCGQLSL